VATTGPRGDDGARECDDNNKIRRQGNALKASKTFVLHIHTKRTRAQNASPALALTRGEDRRAGRPFLILEFFVVGPIYLRNKVEEGARIKG
jgi:hypothetical protein